MKILRQFLFTIFAVAGLALAVSAQKNDQKKPPKPPPPVVVPGKPTPTPKDDKKPKKPGMSLFEVIKGSATTA
jgi:hypothetical protein